MICRILGPTNLVQYLCDWINNPSIFAHAVISELVSQVSLWLPGVMQHFGGSECPINSCSNSQVPRVQLTCFISKSSSFEARTVTSRQTVK